ncbi:MAG: hypothetical protein HY296_01330 [Thaumarchaeota archaeon]|nr:hypothetical protein [Nitrososphaerota archaeon]
MGKVPSWVKLGKNVTVHPSVVFVPHKEMPTTIGNGAKLDSGSVVYGDVSVGSDCIVGHNAVIRQGLRIGVHSIISNLCMLEGNALIGEHTVITSQNHIAQKTKIGDYVFFAPSSTTTNDPKMYYARKEYSRDTGGHWNLLDGPTIGDGARIAAGVSG